MAQFDLKRLFRVPTPTERLAGLDLRPDLARAAVRMASDERSDREVQQLERWLLDTETVVSVVEGRRERRMGLLALTTERLLFRPHGSTSPAETHLLSAVTGVGSEGRSMTGRVVLQLSDANAADSPFTVDKILGTQAQQFAAAVQRQLSGPADEPASDPVQELLDLRARRQAGSITESEFQAAKVRLLDEL